jgi:hypothetical protein
MHDGTSEFKFAVAGAGTEEGVSEVYDCTNVDGSDGAAAKHSH